MLDVRRSPCALLPRLPLALPFCLSLFLSSRVTPFSGAIADPKENGVCFSNDEFLCYSRAVIKAVINESVLLHLGRGRYGRSTRGCLALCRPSSVFLPLPPARSNACSSRFITRRLRDSGAVIGHLSRSCRVRIKPQSDTRQSSSASAPRSAPAPLVRVRHFHR
jgi:hypothetical protein